MAELVKLQIPTLPETAYTTEQQTTAEEKKEEEKGGRERRRKESGGKTGVHIVARDEAGESQLTSGQAVSQSL